MPCVRRFPFRKSGSTAFVVVGISSVDVVSQRAIERSSNWVRRKAIMESAEPFYEGVDLEEVWKMGTSDLLQLIRWIEPLVSWHDGRMDPVRHPDFIQLLYPCAGNFQCRPLTDVGLGSR